MTSFHDGVNLTTYCYDASGYRITKTGTSGTIYFVMGVGEYHNSSWIRIYINVGGKKLAEYSDNTTYFYAHDHLGSPAVITDHTGAVTAKYRYYPFGEDWIKEGTKSDRHRFSGAERDGESGLSYHGARHYYSAYGRWISADPVLGDTSNPQRLNRYGYVLNDPVSFSDPDGRQEIGDLCYCPFS
jgi:RHS repeat-associated protein